MFDACPPFPPSTTRRVTSLVWDLFRALSSQARPWFARTDASLCHSVSAKTHEITTLMSDKKQSYIYIYIYFCSSTGAEGIIGVLAWSASDHEGRRRLVAMKTKETTLTVNANQYALTRAIQEHECRELYEAIENMNERQGKLMSTKERKQKLMGEVPELRENMPKRLGFKFFEIAAVVSEGGATHTINLCRKWYNMRRAKQGEAKVDASQWRALIE